MANNPKPKRRTSARAGISGKRRAAITTEVEEERPLTGNFFERQTPTNKVYYMKLIFGLTSGLVLGLFYNNPTVAGNWFFIPIIGLMIIWIVARLYLKISTDDLNDLKFFAWTGTISLFISFIFSSTLMWLLIHPTSVTF